MIYKILSIVFLASTAIASYMVWQKPVSVTVNTKDGQKIEAVPCSTPELSLLGFSQDTQAEAIHIHVSYNSLTGGRSKTTWSGNGEKRYVLMGEDGGHLYRCAVSKGFWDAISENSFIDVPRGQCQELRP